MDAEAQLSALLDLAESMGIAVRRAPSWALGETGPDADDGHPGGALVRLKGREVLFLDPTAPVADRIAVAAAALRGRPELDSHFLPPAIRELLE